MIHLHGIMRNDIIACSFDYISAHLENKNFDIPATSTPRLPLVTYLQNHVSGIGTAYTLTIGGGRRDSPMFNADKLHTKCTR